MLIGSTPGCSPATIAALYGTYPPAACNSPPFRMEGAGFRAFPDGVINYGENYFGAALKRLYNFGQSLTWHHQTCSDVSPFHRAPAGFQP